MVDMSSLNVNQRIAVNWGRGPLLVLAGPGSGKTRVLTYRMAHLIEESPEESFCILGLTFTTKAATEMQRRVSALVPNTGERVNLTTFHAFSAAILRQHGHHLGIRPDFTILADDEERLAILNDAVSRAGMAHSEDYTDKRLLSLVTRMAEQSVAVDTAAEFPQGELHDSARHIGDVYAHYRRLMIENNKLDFSALVVEALRLLANPVGARLIRRIYPYVCVDEFQDTSWAQYQILCKIVDPSTKNLFVVADDDQTIYEWNGANMMGRKSLQDHFNATVLELPENYRCPSEVVGMANRLIANNPSHSRTDSISGKQDDPDHVVQTRWFGTAEEEVDWVAKDIAERSAGSQDTYAVLARTRLALEQVVTVLNKHGLHGYLHTNKKEFVNDRMVWLHSVLRLANSRQDGVHLHRVCKSFSALEGVDLIVADIVSEATITDSDYLSAWARAALRGNLDSTTRVFLETSVPKLANKLDVQRFIQDCFEWFDHRQRANPEPDYETDYKEERDVWGALVDDAVGDIGHEQVTLSGLLQHIDFRSKEPPVPEGAIHCYTIFASKGMEFDHVYLIRLAEDELPDWRAVNKGGESRQMQEERRVCFVAITRTQKSLTLTYPLSMSGHVKKPSRFLFEMGVRQD